MTREVKNILWLPEDGDPRLALIPGDYREKGVEPICIRAIDDKERPVYRGWIEAACRIQHSLRFFARTIVHDLPRVSELADGSVHAMSATHWDKMGTRPHYQLFVHARWLAQDMAAGSHRMRLQKDVPLPDGMLVALEDKSDLAEDFANRDLFIKLEQRLREAGRNDATKLIQMYLSGSAHEIAKAFGIPPGKAGYRARNTLMQRIRREVRREFESLTTGRDDHKGVA